MYYNTILTYEQYVEKTTCRAYKEWCPWYTGPIFCITTIIQNILHVHSALHILTFISKSRPQATFLSFYPTHTVKLGRTENPTPKNVIRSRDTCIPLNNHLRHVTVGFVALVESVPVPSSYIVLSSKGEAFPDFCQCGLGLFVLLSKLFPCRPQGLVKAAERQELLMMCHTQSRYLSPKSAKTQIMTHMIITNRPCH